MRVKIPKSSYLVHAFLVPWWHVTACKVARIPPPPEPRRSLGGSSPARHAHASPRAGAGGGRVEGGGDSVASARSDGVYLIKR